MNPLAALLLAGLGAGVAADPTAAIPLIGAVGTRGIPVLGAGCRGLQPGAETEDVVRAALQMGYRMIDTAAIDGNEESVGRALRASGVPRSQVFLVSRLRPDDHGYAEAHRGLRASLRRLGVDYVDLVVQTSRKFVETWDALAELRMMGLARSIGVSAFDVRHLEAFAAHGRQLPAVNQVEVHPLNWHVRKPLVDWCRQRGVVVQAYGSLRPAAGELSGKSPASEVAAAKGRTPAQVLLRWAYQMGFQVVPRSRRRERLVENKQIFDFELSEEDMAALSSTDGPAGARRQLEGKEEHPLDLGDTSHAGPGARAAAQRERGDAVEL